ncbi:hypothetical protein BDP27DRAFT_1379534 [Rhodocollybia butyracea]|uniref:Uncharacterized protein n=1 Tax=Rhodocollybia butyracea TaxID=206335 RepID=A0A9P5Q958_9AGAR|nr:hypothetical protein BDP27DRAFT_1379534 [Rhodocollybia butyracea]
MENLCDEILQLIFYELHDPMPFILLSKRLYNFSQDPYARAHYFLNRYGPAQAVFEALGRGKVLDEKVLDILMSSGAHLSRYLAQVAIHHYFYTQTHFVKTRWARSVRLPVFIYFMQIASARYGDIPREKGQDDGSLFSSFLKESRYPPSMRSTNWETIRDILETYKDPIMAQFPLALAVEPRLLPYAVDNGFCMDEKYRDFVFRKMFESTLTASDRTADTIVLNVRELCRLDPLMFLSRTVAAEICMEAKSNEVGYNALKLLAKSDALRFDLSTLVEDLIKLFLTSRSITSLTNQLNLRHLFADFPSSDPAVRLVILLTAFLSVEHGNTQHCISSVKAKLEPLKLGRITLKDMLNLLLHPFMDRYTAVFEYMKTELETMDQSRKGLNRGEMKLVAENVATRLLEIDCKGKLLKRLHDEYPALHTTIIRTIMDKHRISIEDLPDSEDQEASSTYEASLCTDGGFKPPEFLSNDTPSVDGLLGGEDIELKLEAVEVGEGNCGATAMELGNIGRESLSHMIRQEEQLPSRSRRRIHYAYFYDHGLDFVPSGKYAYCASVAKWVKNDFGPRSSITAIFMTHAVLNDNCTVLRNYLYDSSPVPITLKHFELLARLGRSVGYIIFPAIQEGAEFFRSEEDYIDSKYDCSMRIYSQVKISSATASKAVSKSFTVPTVTKKRPRRSVAVNRSYAAPDSDGEEDLVDAMMVDVPEEKVDQKKFDQLDLWIKHLGDLQKTEQSKFRQRKKLAGNDPNVDVEKTEFLKSLSSNLRALRKYVAEQRKSIETGGESDYDDSEYIFKSAKKRRI